MTGDLTLSIDDDEMRVLGCSDLSPNKYFLSIVGGPIESILFHFAKSSCFRDNAWFSYLSERGRRLSDWNRRPPS